MHPTCNFAFFRDHFYLFDVGVPYINAEVVYTYRRNSRGTECPYPPLFWSGRTDLPLYKYIKSEIMFGPPHFSDQSYVTVYTL